MDQSLWAVFSAIQSIWDQAHEIGPDVQSVIDSLFSRPSASELQCLMDTGENHDTCSVEQLLFFPDERQQEALEPRIENRSWTRDEQDLLKAAFAREQPLGRFFFTDGRGEIQLLVSPQSAAAYVERLHLLRSLDPRLRACVETRVHPDFIRRVKVLFRNSRFVWTEDRIGFFLELFEKFSFDDNVGPLAFLLEFMRELAPDCDMVAELLKKKRKLFTYLQLARRADTRLRSATMETIVGSGIRIPHVDRDETRRQMQVIDCITRDLYGVTENIDAIVCHEEAVLMRENADTVNRLLR